MIGRLIQHPSIRSHLAQGSKFLVAGGLGAVVDFSMLNLFTWAFSLDPRIANIFSTLIASVVVFLLNKYFAFRDREGSAGTQAGRFFLVYALAYVLNVSFTALFITIGVRLLLPIHPALLANLSKAAAIGVVMFWNYFLLHSFVFRKQESGARS